MQEKVCTICRTKKSISDFSPSGAKKKDGTLVLRSACKECNTKTTSAYNKKYRQIIRYRQYGLTIEDYKKMLEDQKGCCAICGIHLGNRTHIDHCHTTQKVRKVLCHNCNVGLGHFRDSISFLENAINYLKEFQDE